MIYLCQTASIIFSFDRLFDSMSGNKPQIWNRWMVKLWISKGFGNEVWISMIKIEDNWMQVSNLVIHRP